MTLPISILKKFEILEKMVPGMWQLPFRYWGQKLTKSLEKEMMLLPDLVDTASESIDVGANKGVYAYLLSKLTKHVYCFEPISELCDYISQYKKDNITVINSGLSDKCGSLELKIPKYKGRLVTTRASFVNEADVFEQRNVRVSKLDDFDYKNIGFIKIDVEGAEYEVINGALNTIKVNRPIMLVEIVVEQYKYESCCELFSLFAGLDYVPMLVDDGLTKVEANEFCNNRSFAGNVFFIPKERI